MTHTHTQVDQSIINRFVFLDMLCLLLENENKKRKMQKTPYSFQVHFSLGALENLEQKNQQ